MSAEAGREATDVKWCGRAPAYRCIYLDEGEAEPCELHAQEGRDATPEYLCNCDQTFPSHLARAAHIGGCPVMQAGREPSTSTGGTMRTLADEINDALRPLGGYLRCETCRYELPLGNVGLCITDGWPACHGETMRWWTQRQIDAGEVPA